MTLRFYCRYAGLLLLLLSSQLFAQTTPVPPLMNFQGRLAKPDGSPVPDGSYNLTFRIWDTATGGTKRWEQTINPVLVRKGVFSVLLGNGNPLTDAILNNTPYLEMQVGSDTPLSPRQAFASVGFAFKANTVPDGAITNLKIADSAVTAGKLATDAGSLQKVSGGVMNLQNGSLGIGETVPLSRLYLQSSFQQGGTGTFSVDAPGVGGGRFRILENGNVGVGTNDPKGILDVAGNLIFGNNPNSYIGGWFNGTRVTGSTIVLDCNPTGNTGAQVRIGGSGAADDGLAISLISSDGQRDAGYLYIGGGRTGAIPRMYLWSSYIELGGNVNIPGGKNLTVSGNANIGGVMTANEVQVTGSDVAEPYHIAAVRDVKPAPGIVVTLDTKNPGRLQVAHKPYDHTVAGIISGANGVKPGLLLRQPGTLADGNLPVASMGRVYCWCDADANGAIQIGDLLTTSKTPGHAMKATDAARRQGAILGKAMSTLKKGKGLILVLVTLQ